MIEPEDILKVMGVEANVNWIDSASSYVILD